MRALVLRFFRQQPAEGFGSLIDRKKMVPMPLRDDFG
jgi:hypothetical protein